MSDFLIFKASAGAGKTYNLALQYILRLLLDGGDAHRHILAVTFTKEATSEMKIRILSDLYALAAGLDESKGFLQSIKNNLPENQYFTDQKIRQTAKFALENILHDYSRFNVGTIDSFFQRVLRNLARELGKGSRFNVDLNQSKAIQQAVSAIIEKSDKDSELLGWITDFIDDKIEQEKPWRIDSELEIFGANIFNESYQQQQQKLIELLENEPDKLKNGVKYCQNFKRGFEKFLIEKADNFFSKSIDKNDFYYGDKGVIGYFKKFKNKKFEEPNSYVNDVLAGNKGNAGDLIFRDLLAETEAFRAKNSAEYISCDFYLKNIYSLALLNYISTEIDAQSRENNRFMLSQTAMLLGEMLDETNDFSFVFEKIGAEVKNVMIDEFQDTSKLQWKNFRSLLAGVAASGDFSMLVGDVKQSIYRWRNGDWRILNDIEQEKSLFLEQNNFRILDTNFRSFKNIIEFNNDIFTKISAALAAEYSAIFPNSEQNPFTKAYADVAQNIAKKESEGYVSVDFFESKEYENQAFERLNEIINTLFEKNYSANEICVLCRTNSQVRSVSNFLKSKDIEVVSNEAFMLSSSAVLQLIISALRVLNSPENPVPLAELYFLKERIFTQRTQSERKENTALTVAGAALKSVPENDAEWITNPRQQGTMHPQREIISPEKILETLPIGFKPENFETLKITPLYELVLKIIYLFDLEKVKAQSAYIFTFIDAVFSYLKDHSSDIASFLDFWAEELNRQTVSSNSTINGVRVMTIHKSKGLEFPCVILPYCFGEMAEHQRANLQSIVWCEPKKPPFDLPILPVNYTKSMEKSLFKPDYDKEKVLRFMDNLNIYYVAFTRAVQNLYIFSQKPAKTSQNLTFQQLLLKSLNVENDNFEKGELAENTTTAVASLQLVPENDINSAQVENLCKQNIQPKQQNVLKNQDVTPISVDFCANCEIDKKMLFLQSNQSKEFISDEDGQTKPYILQGNIMHRLFANIFTENDVEKAVERLIFDGIISQTEREKYVSDVQNALSHPDVKDWFNGTYRVLNETEILVKAKIFSSLQSPPPLEIFRPDRIMIFDNSAIVVDYKFGIPKPTHKNQVQNYINLLQSMNYSNVLGYIWYVNEGKIEACR
ncbi:MAG: UvrD-helicase domain-containing protein [Prevotellaceae bacterium]|jgi:ATP-dependent exoDNAse (exonuclease V) beta subunit|nr:UvrD-helicase domain-containing protein [Prevotellaceae bacterium]